MLQGTEVKSLRMGRASLGRRVRRHRRPRGLAARRAHPGVHPGHLDQPRRPAQAQAAAQPRSRSTRSSAGSTSRASPSSRWRCTSSTAGPRSRSRWPRARSRGTSGTRSPSGRPTARRSRRSAAGSRAWMTDGRRGDVGTVRAFWRGSACPGCSTRTSTSCRPTSSARCGRSSTAPARRSAASGRSATAAAVEERVELLRSFGVRRFPTLPYAHKPGVATYLNDWARDFAADVPGVAVVGDVLPRAGGGGVRRRAGRATASRCSRCTCRWGSSTSTTRCSTRCGGCSPTPGRRSWSTPARARSATTFTGPASMARLLARHPAAGAGRRAPRRAGVRGVPRPRRDATTGPPRHHDGVHRLLRPLPGRAAAAAGRPAADRILLGTDFPTIPYPYAHQLEGLAAARPRRRLAARGVLGERRPAVRRHWVIGCQAGRPNLPRAICVRLRAVSADRVDPAQKASEVGCSHRDQLTVRAPGQGRRRPVEAEAVARVVQDRR